MTPEAAKRLIREVRTPESPEKLTERETDREEIVEAIGNAGPERILFVADAFRIGMTREEIFEETAIDPWFLAQIEQIIGAEKVLAGVTTIEEVRANS